MKFKGLLTEAFIDTLPLSKVEKYILNKIHGSDIVTDVVDSKLIEMFNNISTELAVDFDLVMRMFLTYQKYKDILFSEKGIKVIEKYDTLNPSLREVTRQKVLESIFKNYNERQVFDNEGIVCTIYFNEGLEGAIEDDMNPEFYVRMPVAGEYIGIVRGGGKKGEEYSVDDPTFFGSVFLSILPRPNLGYDFINFSDDSFGDWIYHYKGKKSATDIVESGNIKGSAIPAPKNYSEEELKKYADKWVEMCTRIVKKNIPLLHEYRDFVEHGGIFEGYKRK